jgi:hypothetical protein
MPFVMASPIGYSTECLLRSGLAIRCYRSLLFEEGNGRMRAHAAIVTSRQLSLPQVTAISVGSIFVFFLAKGVSKFMGYGQFQQSICWILNLRSNFPLRDPDAENRASSNTVVLPRKFTPLICSFRNSCNVRAPTPTSPPE